MEALRVCIAQFKRSAEIQTDGFELDFVLELFEARPCKTSSIRHLRTPRLTP